MPRGVELLKTLQLMDRKPGIGSGAQRSCIIPRGSIQLQHHTQPQLQALNELVITRPFKTLNFKYIKSPGDFVALDILITLRGGWQGS